MTSNKCCNVITISKASEVPLKPIDGKPTLVYWDIVGIAHPLRMALTLAVGVEWNDVRMVCGSGGDSNANKKEWWEAKKNLRSATQLDFPNLPYYMDNEVQLVHSEAILRYLGNKYNLMGIVDAHVTDVFVEEARDLDNTIIQLSYVKGGAAVATWLCGEGFKGQMKIWGDLIGRKSGPFVSSSSAVVTVVDLKLYTFLYKVRHAQAELMVTGEKTPSLPFWVPAYMERVEKATPQLEEYLNSPDMKIPINNPHALFDNS